MNTEATAAVYEIRSDAEIARARLAADGIEAWLSVDDEGGLNPGFYARYGIRLVVRPEDLDDAYESLGIEHLEVPAQVADAMFKHAGWAYPEEACGVVVFNDSQPVLTICLSNADASAERFTISPAEQFAANRFAEQRDERVGAIFHSHPMSDAYPSQWDVEGGADPEWIHFIIGPVSGPRPYLRAFRIVGGDVTEVKITVGQ
ncbi:MAG: M67 family metallopeptidase [Actinomycetota bacterium]